MHKLETGNLDKRMETFVMAILNWEPSAAIDWLIWQAAGTVDRKSFCMDQQILLI